VSAEELRQYIEDFFNINFPGCKLQWDHPITGTFRLELTWKAHDSLTDYLFEQKLETPPEMQARVITGTLFSEMAKKRQMVNQRRLVLVTHLSPLVRWITAHNKQRTGAFYDVSALQVNLDAFLPGIYAYRIERWQLKGLRSREVLSYACMMAGGDLMPPKDAEQTMNLVLKHAKTWRHPEYPSESALLALDQLRDSLHNRVEEIHQDFHVRNAALISIHRAQSENRLKRKQDLVERSIATLRSRGRSERMVSLAKRQLDSEIELAAKRSRDLERDSAISIRVQDIAAGIFQVKHP
jgi:hypothetical protein